MSRPPKWVLWCLYFGSLLMAVSASKVMDHDLGEFFKLPLNFIAGFIFALITIRPDQSKER